MRFQRRLKNAKLVNKKRGGKKQLKCVNEILSHFILLSSCTFLKKVRLYIEVEFFTLKKVSPWFLNVAHYGGLPVKLEVESAGLD